MSTTTAAVRPSVRWLRRARRTPALVAGTAILVVVGVVAVLAPVIAPYDPASQDLGNGLAPPSAAHWFGTDQLGRDILSRVMAAGAGERGIYLAYALVGWITYARVIRARTRTLCREGWVQAARGGGLSHGRVLFGHLLPNVAPLAVVLLMTEILLIMVAVVTLGYLGLGVQPPTPDWGTMISDGQLFLTTRWWVPTLPGLAVVLTGVGLSLTGDGLADVWRLR